jgi:hypothetical protein
LEGSRRGLEVLVDPNQWVVGRKGIEHVGGKEERLEGLVVVGEDLVVEQRGQLVADVESVGFEERVEIHCLELPGR